MCAELLANGLLKADESAVVCDKAAGAAGAIGDKGILGRCSTVKAGTGNRRTFTGEIRRRF